MRMLITGDVTDHRMVTRALDAVHNKRRIVIVLHTGPTLAALTAEQWAHEHGVLCADIHEHNGPVALFEVADSVIAFPGTSADLLRIAQERGAKVWEPYKPKAGGG